MRFILTLWIAKLFCLAINLIDKNRGTSLPGRVALKLMPDFTKHFKGLNPSQILLVTGSNGKSTAMNLLYQLLQNAFPGRVAANIEGANMLDGIATTFIKNVGLSGKVKRDWFVLEADERSLPRIFQNLDARLLAVTNIQMDQAYRNADPDFILRKIEPCITDKMHLFLCAEEPCSLILGDKAGSVTYYGLPHHPYSLEHSSPYFQTRVCPRCGGKLNFDYYNASSIGPFHCTQCDFSTPADDVIRPSQIHFDSASFDFEGATYPVSYNQPYHYYNYALALSFGKWLNLEPQVLRSVYEKTFAYFKNYDENSGAFSYKDKNITYLRFKQENPDTLQNALDRLVCDLAPKTLFLGLYPVQNALPYTADITYAYSVDFEELRHAHLEQIVIFSEPVAYDTKMRFLMAGFEDKNLDVLVTSDIEAILDKLDSSTQENIYLITNRHTYDLIYPKMKARAISAQKEANHE